MYSPKIKNDLIPILFRLAQERDKSMTVIVDELLRPALIEYEESKAIPYCKQGESETFVLYTVPLENVKSRKEVM